MTPHLLGPEPDAFLWATGIEDTFVPQTRPGMRPLDEYDLIGHYDHWREDLALTSELGVRGIRWGVPWYRVEPRPGEFDWSWTDTVIPYITNELGLTLIVDLMHYGCPDWLTRAFADERYPQSVAAYARAFTERYGELVRYYTPLNEPLVTAHYAGRQGVWPPYMRGDSGFVRVLTQVARGIQQTVAAIRAVRPDAIMVHVEATGMYRAAHPDLAPLADDERARSFLCYDLISGRVGPQHPLYIWLLRSGITPAVLAELRHNAIPIEVLGLNFYPQWSTVQYSTTRAGRLLVKPTERTGERFDELITGYYQRYHAPIIITETSALKGHAERSAWLAHSLAAIKQVRGEGVPVLGYTWFPLFTMYDWRYRTGRAPLDAYRVELGLYTLGDGSGPRWQATPLLEQFCAAVRDPASSIGRLGALEHD